MKNVTKSMVRVGTEMFEFAHGKKPRGRGQWVFESNGEQFVAPCCASFGEAKRAAVAWAASRGFMDVQVGA